ncbi:MAG: shikimate kinase [Conexivisphaerales archaeon]|nr:shikimate kinase [Conexivisphaerales archaeon]
MRARAEVNGAVSVLNAAATGFGAAVAISARVSALAEPTDGELDVVFEGVDPGDRRLVEAAASVVSGELGWTGGWRLVIRSELPPRRGLKTSSAVSNALIASMCSALGSDPSPSDVLRMSVLASRMAKVTVTGALDDAGASLLGGFVMADNDSDAIEVRRDVDPDGLEVLLGIPARELDKSVVSREAFAPLAPAALRARDLALEGRYWDAMTVNGLVVSAALGVDSAPAAEAIRAGALGAGITGMGPAIAAVAPEGASERVASSLARAGLRVMRYRLENEPGVWNAEV